MEMLDITQAPVPFLIGVHNSCIPHVDSFQVRSHADQSIVASKLACAIHFLTFICVNRVACVSI